MDDMAARSVIAIGLLVLGVGFCVRPKIKNPMNSALVFFIGLVLLIGGVESKTLNDFKGVPILVDDLRPGKTYQTIGFLPEYNLLLVVREGEGRMGFRVVVDPGKKLKGSEIFVVDDKGEIKVIKP